MIGWKNNNDEKIDRRQKQQNKSKSKKKGEEKEVKVERGNDEDQIMNRKKTQ